MAAQIYLWNINLINYLAIVNDIIYTIIYVYILKK